MNVAIVVAAGKGSRLGGDRPKQFLELGGIPVIIHTLRQFERSKEIHEVITVLPAEETAGFESVVKKFALKKVTAVVAGGATRAQSVRNGLRAISDAEIVAVHDGVRPFVTPAEIDATVAAARRSGAAILTAPVADTIKRVEAGRVIQTSSRASLRRALTPQCFRFEILKRAYEQLDHLESTGVEITDDSLLVEKLNVEIVAVEGSERNIKITNAEDMAVAEMILQLGVVRRA
jgi:2-C-methyl-D-erythritol 4-phosphate cytidylyltransferase